MRTSKPFAAGFALLAICLTSVVWAGEWEFPRDWFWHNDDAQRAKHEALLGKKAPPLDLSDWMNKKLSSKDTEGKIVVVDFWATWCGPCIKSIPHNNELYEKYQSHGVEIVGICTSDRGQEKYASVVKDKNIQYPVARDPNLKSKDSWQVMWYPTYAVVDRKGNVRAVGLKPNHVEDVIKKLLEESPGEKSKSASADK